MRAPRVSIWLDLERLEPDGVSGAVVWKLEAPSPVKTSFYIATDVTGFVAKGKEDGK